jgi:hypothetical protein
MTYLPVGCDDIGDAVVGKVGALIASILTVDDGYITDFKVFPSATIRRPGLSPTITLLILPKRENVPGPSKSPRAGGIAPAIVVTSAKVDIIRTAKFRESATKTHPLLSTAIPMGWLNRA